MVYLEDKKSARKGLNPIKGGILEISYSSTQSKIKTVSIPNDFSIFLYSYKSEDRNDK